MNQILADVTAALNKEEQGVVHGYEKVINSRRIYRIQYVFDCAINDEHHQTWNRVVKPAK